LDVAEFTWRSIRLGLQFPQCGICLGRQFVRESNMRKINLIGMEIRMQQSFANYVLCLPWIALGAVIDFPSGSQV
jgi:hypothetical protein